MKKIVILFIAFFALLSTTFAYEPTSQDEKLLDVFYTAFSKEFSKDLPRATKFISILDGAYMLYLTKDSSGRIPYIIQTLSSYIRTHIIGENKAPIIEKVDSVSPISLNGNGKNITQSFYLVSGLYTFHSINNGDSNFIVKLLDAEGNAVEYLVNEIGQVNQVEAIKISKDGNYLLNVDSKGDWNFTISHYVPDSSKTPSLPISLTANGTLATEFIYLKAGLYKFDLTYIGESNFIVKLLNQAGDIVEYLANEIGATETSEAVQIKKDGYYLFNVDSQGQWSIDISKI